MNAESLDAGKACKDAELATLQMLSQQVDRPLGIQAFDELFREEWRIRQLREGPAKLVGQMCNFVPDELVLAAGAVPLRIDSNCYFMGPDSQERLPADVCCVVKALSVNQGRFLPDYPEVDLLIIPTACDGKRKLAKLMARDSKTFTLELPFEKRGEGALKRWHLQYKKLVKRLESLTGNRISRRSLRRSVALVNRRTELLRQLNQLRSAPKPPLSAADAFLVMHSSFVADVSWWVEKTEVLLEELESRVQAGKGREPTVRLLLTGSPILWPDYELLHMVAETGAEIVADEMCSGTQRLYHPTLEDESTKSGLIRAAAEKSLLPCTCPCFSESDDRQDRLKSLAQTYAVNGVLHHTLRLCQNYDIDAIGLASKVRDLELPWLNIYTEEGAKEAGGTRNRLDAFVEMIAAQ